MDPRFPFAGLIVGTAVGLTGVGGNALLAPLLILLLGVLPTTTVGTDIVYSVPTKILACMLRARQGAIDWVLTKWLVIGGLPGALGGLALFVILKAHVAPKTLQTGITRAIGTAILLACVGIIINWCLKKPVEGEAVAPVRPWPIVAIGAFVGILVSLTSVGSGSMTLPLLAFALPTYGLRRLIGAEIAFAAFLVPLAAAGHAAFGNVDWRIAAGLIVGSLPGVWLGTRLSRFVGDGWLRPVVIGLLALSGWRLV